MTTDLTPTQHRDALLDVFTEITADCERLGLQPCNVGIREDFTGGYGVALQFYVRDGSALSDVDALADAYALAPDDDRAVNYTREGWLEIAGRQVEVTAYARRPAVVHDPDRRVLPATHLHTCLLHPHPGQARSANDAIPAGTS